MSTKLTETYIQYLIAGQEPITCHLQNGVRLGGILTAMDEESFTLSRDNITQLVFKNSVATLLPTNEFSIFDVIGDRDD